MTHTHRGPGLHVWLQLALVILMLSTVSASTVLPLSVVDLTERSGKIFHGVCVQSSPDVVDGDIVTRLRFVVSESLKGMADTDSLSVVLPGGTIDGVRYHISGMPDFVVGEEVVLFLTGPDTAGRTWPVGLAQGDFRVRRRDEGAPRTRRDFEGLKFQASARPAGPAPIIPPLDLPLADLLDEIRTLTNSTGKTR